jgi:plastocyanin
MSEQALDRVAHGGVLAVGAIFLGALAISSFGSGRVSGGTSPSTAAGIPTAKPAAPASLQLAAQDFVFAPTSLSVAPNARVTLAVQNSGAVTHSFSSDSPSVSVDVPAGQTRTVAFTAPASGGVAFYCRFHPRMLGTITIATAAAGG